ncbi:MAG: lysophospholipid acyltransferase family protein [Bacteroidales bacterium]
MRKILFLIAISPIYLISILPIGLLYFVSGIVVFFISRVLRYRRSVVTVNISRAFPSFRYRAIEETSKKFYKNFAEIIAENIKAVSLSKKTISKMGYIENPEILSKYYKKGCPVIVVGGHMGNWELLGKIEHFKNSDLMGFTGHHINFIYKKQRSTVADDIIKWIRKANSNVQLIESKSAARSIIKSREKSGCYFLFSDQSPKPGSRFSLSFLNQPTLMLNGPEVISRSIGCPVVFIEMVREKRGEYIVRFHDITENAAECEPGYVTQTFARLLEKAIQQQPDNWLWSHKRWKRECTIAQ